MEHVTVVVPAYNESRTIAGVVQGLRDVVQNVVVVDDGSQDATAQEAHNAGSVVLRHAVNRGYGAALVTGTRYAFERGAHVVVHFDADGQHDPADVSRLADSVKVGAPSVALGSRRLGKVLGQPVWRKAVLIAARYFTWLHTGILLSDAHNGLRAYTREAWYKFAFHQDRMAFSSEVVSEIARQRVPWVEVPVTVRYTQDSLRGSKQGKFPSFKIVRDLMLGKFIK